MRVRVGHASLQFSDSSKQHTHDVEKIFDRAVNRKYAWLTGTEAGPGAGNTGAELVRTAKEHGYRPYVPSRQEDGISRHADCWIAVREDLIGSDYKRDFRYVIPGSGQLADKLDLKGKRWGPKGLATVSFQSSNVELGRVSIGAAHYLTGARNPNSEFWEWNDKLAAEIGDWAREEGKGPAIVAYGGDQNMHDGRNNQPQGDTFMGEPLTSVWDEIGKWPNTGHGTIDVIATYNRDKRVKALNGQAFNDKKFFLHSDHSLIEAVLQVDPAKKR